MYTSQLSGIVFRGLNSTRNTTRLTPFHEQFKTYKFGNCRRRISFWFKEQSIQVAQACTRQFEFIAAQRIRRSVQVFHLYTRIWDEVALKEFMKSWRRRLAKNTHNFLISAIGVTLYDWDREKITDQEINRYNNEIEGIYKLRDSTVVCPNCHFRIIIDVAQPDIKYCTCRDAQFSATVNEGCKVLTGGWQPFIERKDMLIWRRQEPNFNGLYAYKVYGSFPEVTADDFLSVQIDGDYRKQWDPTAKELEVVESHPQMKTSGIDCTDIVHWEMIWPRLFANRDYVFQRRWVINRANGVVVIVSKITNHPKVPVKPGVHRVTSYWSTMVIKPYTEFHEPGIEFGLTYFDDPGVSIPSAVTAWVAMTGLADFMMRMRQASTEYKKYKLLTQGAKSSENSAISKQDSISELQEQNMCDKTDTETDILEEENENLDKPVEDRNTEGNGANQGNNEIPDKSASSTPKKDQELILMSRQFYVTFHEENDLLPRLLHTDHYNITEPLLWMVNTMEQLTVQ